VRFRMRKWHLVEQRRLRWLVATLFVAAVVATANEPAYGARTLVAHTWQLDHTYYRGSSAMSAACRSNGSCVVVGYLANRLLTNNDGIAIGPDAFRAVVTATRVERRTGLPAGSAAACRGDLCVSVGGSIFGLKAITLRGPGWQGVPVSGPPRVNADSLTSVACASSSHCFAVGLTDYRTTTTCTTPASVGACISTEPIVEEMHPGGWSVLEPSATPLASPEPDLTRIACANGAFCVATGTSGVGSATPVELSWIHGVWAEQNLPLPAAAAEPVINDVACSASATCVAVGGYEAAGVERPLVLRRRGGTWRVVVLQLPRAGESATLSSVACATSAYCVAVGSRRTRYGDSRPLVETWMHNRWRSTAVPAPTGAKGFASVACSSTGCVAVGNFGRGARSSWFLLRDAIPANGMSAQ